jgi:hypothetical protein
VFHVQMRCLNQTPRSMRCAGEFSTMTAVTVSRTLDGAGDLIRDTAAEATGFHGDVSLAVGGPTRTVHPLPRACPFHRKDETRRPVAATPIVREKAPPKEEFSVTAAYTRRSRPVVQNGCVTEVAVQIELVWEEPTLPSTARLVLQCAPNASNTIIQSRQTLRSRTAPDADRAPQCSHRLHR